MAKVQHEDKSLTKQGQSPYGSHSSMVNFDVKFEDPSFVLAEDEVGRYATKRSYLDNGLADPYRFASEQWREKLLKKLWV